MNNIPNDILEEIILNKIKLFTKDNYYRQFRSILLEFYKNIYAFKKKTSLSMSMMSKIKERNKSSLWFIIYIIILPLKSELKEENIFKNEYNLNPLCFQYLKNLCFVRMKKLINFAMVENVSMENILPVYLNLCEKHLRSNREKRMGTLKSKGNNLQNNSNRKASLLFTKQNSIINRPLLKINVKKIINKNGPSIQPLEYSNSFTRLFIGETDEQSIRERYLSNMIVKKQKQLHLLNSYGELSVMYLQKMYKKLFKNEGGTMDNDMINIIKQFENDHKRIDNYQRSSESSEKPHYIQDLNNNNIFALELNKEKEKINYKNRNRNRNIKAKRKHNKYNSNSILRSTEVSKNNIDIKLKSLYSRKNIYKLKNNSINYEKHKKFDDFIFPRKIINSTSSYKIINFKKYNIYKERNMQKNYSAFFGISNIKNSNQKKSSIKNYMNKSDFFFL